MRHVVSIIGVLCTFLLTGSWSLAVHPSDGRDPSPMVKIPAGMFIRGSAEGEGRADENPRRKIYVDTFHIDQYEVTNGQYIKFLSETGHKEPFNVYGEGSLLKMEGVSRLPVVQVTWHDAVDYCRWAGKRLPTEAEWEKAARGTKAQLYPWGETPATSHLANFDRDWDNENTLLPIGSLPEGMSPYGVYDMAGNVREWVQDWYAADYYKTASGRNPRGPESGILKVVRGGSWHSFEADIRAAARGKGGFALKTHGVGFRCAKNDSGNKKINHKSE